MNIIALLFVESARNHYFVTLSMTLIWILVWIIAFVFQFLVVNHKAITQLDCSMLQYFEVDVSLMIPCLMYNLLFHRLAITFSYNFKNTIDCENCSMILTVGSMSLSLCLRFQDKDYWQSISTLTKHGSICFTLICIEFPFL